jgi:hypothetical protein
MSSKSHKHALTVFADPKVRAATPTDQLVEIARVQLAAIPALENEAAVRAVLLGLTLQKLRAGAPHGTWVEQLTQMLTATNVWTPKTAKVNASYYMRLASFFVEKTRVTVPEMLALPGDQTELAIDENSSAQARRFSEKLGKFVGQWSLNELLVRNGIKGVQRDQEDDNQPPEKQLENAREKVWEKAWNGVEALFEVFSKDDEIHQLDNQRYDLLAHRLSEVNRLFQSRRSSKAITV